MAVGPDQMLRNGLKQLGDVPHGWDSLRRRRPDIQEPGQRVDGVATYDVRADLDVPTTFEVR
nr:hypothetical protein GCM10020063_041860 [Dactylosporangium thailandense]